MSFKLPRGAISVFGPLFHPGELVLVHTGAVLKGDSPYKGPLKAEKVLGCIVKLIPVQEQWLIG